MNVDGSGVRLDAAELDGWAGTLASIAKANTDVRLRHFVDGLAMISAQISALSTLDDEPPTMTTSEYASIVGKTDRAIRYRIQRKQLAAEKVGTTWQIPANIVGSHPTMPTNAG